jgi:sigma-B regulation protein RsbU (phosphoserine phosphatase)
MSDPGRTAEGPGAQRLMSEMQFLSELCQVVAGQSDLQTILDWIVQRTTLLFRADAGSIKLLGPDPGLPMAQTIVSTRKSAELQSGSWPREYSISVMGHLMIHPQTLATPDITADPRFQALRGSAAPIRAVLAAPLVVENRVTGMLAVTQRTPGRGWTADEAALLGIVASNSAGAIEQARLRAEAEAKKQLEIEKRQLERDLQTARDIQMSLVPAGPLRVGPWEADGRVVPARHVGGDSFDYFALDGGRLAVAIADVAGKGVPAAILMANVQAKIRAACTGASAVGDAIADVNRSVAARAPAGKFITLFYAEIDPGAGRLRYCNAGHNPPLLRRGDGRIEDLTTGGLPLGLFEAATFEAGEAAFAPGDALLLFSDGITEAFDTRDQEFGDERLRAWWTGRADTRPGDVVRDLVGEVERHRGSAAQSDDITVVAVAAP